jgi:uncharacterized protein YcfJ
MQSFEASRFISGGSREEWPSSVTALRRKKEQRRARSTATGAMIGGVVGTFLGPIGILGGVLLGGAIGNSEDPEDDIWID